MTPWKLWTLFSQRNLYVLYCWVWSVRLSQTLGTDVNTVSSYVSVCHVKNKLSTMLIFFCFSFYFLRQSKCKRLNVKTNDLQHLLNVFTVQHAQSTKDSRPSFFICCIYSLTINWCRGSKWSPCCFFKSLYLKHVILEALRKWSFACLLYICDDVFVICFDLRLWTIYPHCSLLAVAYPCTSAVSKLLMVTVSSIRLYNKACNSCLHLPSCWRTQHCYVQWVLND